MLGKIIDWIDERSGVRELAQRAFGDAVPGGARVRYVFGSVLTYLFMQQIVIGILLATYYSPSVTDAWASTAYIQDQVAGGWFLRGLHNHGSSAMIVLLAVHMVQVVLAGAYRKPRELTWWTGLAMGGLVIAIALSGYVLIWDQNAYWGRQVRAGIMGTVPFGDIVQELLKGGDQDGNLTITRFYVLHVLVLPLGLAGLLGAHVYLVRRHKVTPPVKLGEDELAAKAQPRWPNQLFIDVVAMAITGAVLVVMTYSTHGAALLAPADPASNYVARPEWFFLSLFQLLKFFEGPLSFIGTIIIPGAATTFLVVLPFLDRSESRELKGRTPVLAGVGLIMGGIVALTTLAVASDANNEEYQESVVAAEEEAARARGFALEGVPPEGGVAVFKNDPQYAARQLFKDNCAGCHAIEGKGAQDAPTLTNFNDRAWLRGAVREPRSADYFGGTKDHETMEAYSAEDLPDDKLDAVIEYLIELREAAEETPNTAAYDAQLAKQGAALWEELDCSGCHEVEKEAEGGLAPIFWGRGTQAWIGRVIRNSSLPRLYGDEASMPKFDDKLSDEEIETLAAYVYAQGVSAPADASADDDE